MNYTSYTLSREKVTVSVASFLPSGGGEAEYHLQLRTEPGEPFHRQLENLHDAFRETFSRLLPQKVVPVVRRYFLSDAANQASLLEKEIRDIDPSPASVIQQPPLDGSKVSLWVYAAQGMERRGRAAAHGRYTHYWSCGNLSPQGNSEEQTVRLLAEYDHRMGLQGLALSTHCLRTWLFVQNIDVNYGGVVKGRRDFFAGAGLTPETHFIASTGIEGRHADKQTLVTFDAYAVQGLQPEQIRYLQALTHLNPTYEYGVTFERGTAVEYGDRKHLFISGTASINNKGDVMYSGDVIAQARRMRENVEALLIEGGATLNDVAMAVVYLRDTADYAAIRALFAEEMPQLPSLFVWAPVCRPAWLIEMECIAVAPNSNGRFGDF